MPSSSCPCPHAAATPAPRWRRLQLSRKVNDGLVRLFSTQTFNRAYHYCSAWSLRSWDKGAGCVHAYALRGAVHPSWSQSVRCKHVPLVGQHVLWTKPLFQPSGKRTELGSEASGAASLGDVEVVGGLYLAANCLLENAWLHEGWVGIVHMCPWWGMCDGWMPHAILVQPGYSC